MDYKNVIIIVLVIALAGVLFYFLNKSKDKNQKKDSGSESYQYMTKEQIKRQNMANGKNKINTNIDYNVESEGNYIPVNGKEIGDQLIKEADDGMDITDSSLARNIQALSYKMDSQVNINEYKDFIENQYSSEDKYNTIFAPEDTFQTIVQNDPSIPSAEKVRSDFKECMKSGNNTVEACLTSSSSGLYPGLTKSLCQEYYDPLSPVCNQIAIRQMKQMNSSARSGPA
jgi:hypothetical protein